MTSPTKNLKFKSFQFFKILTTRLVTSLEGMNSSLSQSAGGLRWQKVRQKSSSRGISKYDDIVH